MRAALLPLLLAASPALAWDPNAIEVDVELLLAVDVSRSITPAEMEIQRRGYAEALTSPEVIAAIQSGLLGRIAISYVEWAGTGTQRVILPWTTLETTEQAQALADRLTTGLDQALRRTSISGVLLYGIEAFRDNGYSGLRQVIDISGDGPNNEGRPVLRARAAALKAGIVINGLPLMTRDGLGLRWHLDDLDLYYQDCVIGGPGAFVIPVTDWDQFADAVRRKLVLEIAGRAPPATIRPVQYTQNYDCLIGEKIWEQNRHLWQGP